MNSNLSTVKSLSNKILHICRHEYNFFLSKSNVVGLGLSYKIVNGFNTLNECIKVFVTKKVSKDKLLEKDLIPSLYKGIRTDVVEDGINTFLALTTRIRPVPAGYSISPIKGIYGGTFGCLVTDGRYYYVLSNNHVLAACNASPLGLPIVQPSIVFGGKDPKDTVAHLSKFLPLEIKTESNPPENFADCAMAKIDKRSMFSTKLAILGKIHGIASPSLDQPVQKVGCTTELTQGKIIALGTTRVARFADVPYLFLDQIITTYMASEGDSGSVLLDTNMNVLGLIMSGSSTSVTANPINYVLSNLNVSIVTK